MRSMFEGWLLGGALRILKKLESQMQNRDIRDASEILPRKELFKEIKERAGRLELKWESHRKSCDREARQKAV